jgi:transposase
MTAVTKIERNHSMNQISTIGLDLAKNIFQVHGIDARGKVIIRKPLRRSEVLKFFASVPPCLIGIEACATAHHWGRELGKLGHAVRLMPPAYVKAYVKRAGPMRPTRRRSARPSRGQPCALLQSRAWNSRAC